MSFTVRTEEEFTPSKPRNGEGESPIVFHLKYLNTVERDSLINLEYLDGKSRVKPDFVRACKVGITSIENFIVNGKEIKTADDFLKTPYHDTMLEVGGKVFMMNPITDEESLKN
jgi:hypothetical protein